jgi:Mg2+ and Co2+ transporter CorA
MYPTYLLLKDNLLAPDDPSLEREWPNYEYRIRLSRAGFLEVKLTRVISPGGENIISVLQGLMELAARGDHAGDRQSLQLKLALHCADQFIKSLPETLRVFEEKSRRTSDICLKRIGADPDRLPYRQRYMTMVFRELTCEKCGCRIEANKLHTDYNATLAAILEGVLVERQDGRLTLPDMDEGRIKIEDLASWKDDLCIFAPERSLIYFPEKNIYLTGQTGTKMVSYGHYWDCIVRGIEHTLVVRAALQIIEYSTTRDLDEVPRLTQRVVDGEVTKDDRLEISHMAQAVANTFSTLPRLRDVLVPSSSYRASYAVRKFETLNSVLDMKDIEQHVERNVDELVGFVQFFSSMELQEELNQNEETINRVGIVIALVALTVAAPSFVADFEGVAGTTNEVTFWIALIVFIIIAVLTLLLIYRLLWKPTFSLRKLFGKVDKPKG